MTTEDLRRQALDDDGSLPERWNAEDTPGAILVGTLLRYEQIVTDYGEAQVAVIEDEDDQHVWGVALFRSVLKKKFDQLEPKPGDLLALKYVGLAEPRSKDARPYHNYVLKVQHTPASMLKAAVEAEAPEEDGELPF